MGLSPARPRGLLAVEGSRDDLPDPGEGIEASEGVPKGGSIWTKGAGGELAAVADERGRAGRSPATERVAAWRRASAGPAPTHRSLRPASAAEAERPWEGHPSLISPSQFCVSLKDSLLLPRPLPLPTLASSDFCSIYMVFSPPSWCVSCPSSGFPSFLAHACPLPSPPALHIRRPTFTSDPLDSLSSTQTAPLRTS